MFEIAIIDEETNTNYFFGFLGIARKRTKIRSMKKSDLIKNQISLEYFFLFIFVE